MLIHVHTGLVIALLQQQPFCTLNVHSFTSPVLCAQHAKHIAKTLLQYLIKNKKADKRRETINLYQLQIYH